MTSKHLPGGVFAHLMYSIALVALGLFIGTKWYYCMPWTQKIEYARALIYPTKNSTVTGVVTFIEDKEGVKVKVTCQNLTPGKHGFHVHEYGDGSCSDGMCTGDHFNPTNAQHGGLQSSERHVGDFGNLEADIKGIAQAEFTAKGLSLNGPHSIIGRSVIVHADEDDLVSQPSGKSGARIGCGVIGTAKTP